MGGTIAADDLVLKKLLRAWLPQNSTLMENFVRNKYERHFSNFTNYYTYICLDIIINDI